MATVSNLLPLSLIPLQRAVLCANCEMVSEGRNGHCIVCGSASLLSLARVLGSTNNPPVLNRFGRRLQENRCTTRRTDSQRRDDWLTSSIPPRLFALAKGARRK